MTTAKTYRDQVNDGYNVYQAHTERCSVFRLNPGTAGGRMRSPSRRSCEPRFREGGE